jgi:hypothetical protein
VARFASIVPVKNESCIGIFGVWGSGSCGPSWGSGAFLDLVEGPVPAAGGIISNLWAEAGGALSGGSATVEVLDLIPPSGPTNTALSCPVAKGGTTCENKGNVPIAAGHYMLVRVKTTALPTTWHVSFRY